MFTLENDDNFAELYIKSGKYLGKKMATESTLSPPAPLDLGRMEMEAKETAKKHIANLLQVHV